MYGILYRLPAALVPLMVRSGCSRDLEIIVLRHQLGAVLRRLVIAMATENPTWGYRRIHGELVCLSHRIAPSTIWRIRRSAGMNPAPRRSEVTWSQFLRSQAAVACDFATIHTVTLRRFYMLFFIHIPSRTVYLDGITEHPSGAWTIEARDFPLAGSQRFPETPVLKRGRHGL